jgi:hypothetical protein
VHAQPILAVINAKPSNSEEGVDDSNWFILSSI